MANLSSFSPRQIEIPQSIFAGRANETISEIISFREKAVEFQHPLIYTDHGLRMRGFAAGFSICFDMAQG